MKKRTALILALITILFVMSANAAEITGVIVSDFDNSVVRVSGTAQESMVSVTALPKGSVLAEGEYNSQNNMSIQKADVANGRFDVSFKLVADTGWYDFYVSGSDEPYTYELISKEAILDFVDELGQGEYTAEELPDKLTYFASGMGIDLSFADSATDMAILVENVLLYTPNIATGGINAVRDIALLTKAELELLDGLSASETATSVNNLITKYAQSAEIDITAYNALGTYSKTQVCNLLIGKLYANKAAFVTEFNTLVANAPTEPESGSVNAGSSPGGSSSGGSFGGGSVSIPATPDIQPIVREDGTRIFDMYSDIDGYPWAWEAILYLSDRNIINGTGNNSFLPGDNLKREQFAKILATAFDCYEADANAQFADIPQNDWAAPYIASVSKHGIMNGTDLGNFGYGQNITRQDICVTIYRAAKLGGYEFKTRKTDFTDFNDVSDYAREAVACLAGEGIISGPGDGTFKPLNSATRAEAAQIVYSVMTKMGKF